MRCSFVSEKSPLSQSSFIGRVLRADLSVVAFVMAVLVYGVFGSPTPSHLGVVEVLVGGLLVFAMGAAGLRGVFCVADGRPVWFWFGQLLLVYGVVAGLIGAAISGHDFIGMMRDFVPFCFLFLPMFFLPLFERMERPFLYVYAFIALGVLFGVRAGAPMLGMVYGGWGYDALYYLGNSPSVLFAALFCFGMAIEVLARGITGGNAIRAAVLLCLAGIALVPIAMTMQRASVAAFLVYGVLAFLILFMRAPRRMVVVGAGIGFVVLALFFPVFAEVFGRLQSKTALVGQNMRAEEWAAVWGEVSGHPLVFLFGNGWGSSFQSPAVADIEVTFTHSLLSSMLLKVGVIGFGLCFAYIIALLWALVGAFRRAPLLVMAVVAPLLIDVFLYAAYKSLDFGLLLGFVPLLNFIAFQRFEEAKSVQ